MFIHRKRIPTFFSFSWLHSIYQNKYYPEFHLYVEILHVTMKPFILIFLNSFIVLLPLFFMLSSLYLDFSHQLSNITIVVTLDKAYIDFAQHSPLLENNSRIFLTILFTLEKISDLTTWLYLFLSICNHITSTERDLFLQLH